METIRRDAKQIKDRIAFLKSRITRDSTEIIGLEEELEG